MRGKSSSRSRWLGITLGCLAVIASAETIRVTSYNLSPSSDQSRSSRIDVTAVALELRRLDPDVILLQHLPDPEACTRLVQALKPSAYKVVVCSEFGITNTPPSPEIDTNYDLKVSYSTQINPTKGQLALTEEQLEQNRAQFDPAAQEFLSQGATNWPEVSLDRAEEYADVARQIEVVGEQERDFRRRGYKEAHPRVQTVRAQLRIFATRKAELERDFPTLRYIVVGTNSPNWALAAQFDENRKLVARTAILREMLRNFEAQLSELGGSSNGSIQPVFARSSGDKGPVSPQVAILAKPNAVISWARPWSDSGALKASGFAFCAVQSPKQRVGFLSAEFGTAEQAKGAVRQLVAEMDLIRKSDPNPIDTFVVACSFATEPKGAAQGRSQALRILARAGFSEAFSELAFERGARDIPNNWASRADWIFVEPTGLALNPQADVDSTNHQPLTCDLELEATKVAVGRLARVEAHTSGPFRGLERPRFFPVWAGVLAFAGVSFFGLAWIVSKAWIRRSGKSIRLIPARGQPALVTPSSYTVIVAPTSITGSAPDPAALPPVAPTVHVDTPGPGPTHSGTWERRALAAEDRAKRAEVVIRQGLFPHLSRWMREKFLQKLLVDRSQLLAAQEEATRKVRAVDARLTKLELQIQEQTRVYVRRIEELTAELQAAKQENRELIRAKITQIKIEMEAARKKLLDAQNKPGGKA